jgi:hypothetical protein
MNMVKLRLPWGSVKAATVSLVVLVAQWLPVSANGGDPLIDTLGSARSTLDKYGISLALQSTDEVFGNPLWGWALTLIKRSILKAGFSTSVHTKLTDTASRQARSII